MRLIHASIKNLFNLFDHEVPINLEERITIIHAPNGYGKTVLLKLISAALSPSLSTLREFEFSSLVLTFDDHRKLQINQRKREIKGSRLRQPEVRVALEFSLTRKGDKELQWTSNPDDQEPPFPLGAIEDIIPSLDRVGPRSWRVGNTGELLSLEEVYARYEDFLPIAARRPPPDWLRQLQAALPVRLIETQRLLARQQGREGRTQRSGFTPVVQDYADELRNSIRTMLAQSATSSQALDRTFPSRLIAQLDQEPATEAQIRTRLTELETARTRLMNAGLLAKGDDDAFISGRTFEPSTRQVLTVYVKDAHEKLVIFNALLEKIELFKAIINSRFTFKSMRADADKGFVIDDIKGRELRPSSLSSGEQHELVLVYELLFKTTKNSLILIDEPEISFHVGWQRDFLKDLKRLIDLAQLDVVLATHSPQLIGGRLDLTVQLKPPQGS